jgi:hypothetical protein
VAESGVPYKLITPGGEITFNEWTTPIGTPTDEVNLIRGTNVPDLWDSWMGAGYSHISAAADPDFQGRGMLITLDTYPSSASWNVLVPHFTQDPIFDEVTGEPDNPAIALLERDAWYGLTVTLKIVEKFIQPSTPGPFKLEAYYNDSNLNAGLLGTINSAKNASAYNVGDVIVMKLKFQAPASLWVGLPAPDWALVAPYVRMNIVPGMSGKLIAGNVRVSKLEDSTQGVPDFADGDTWGWGWDGAIFQSISRRYAPVYNADVLQLTGVSGLTPEVRKTVRNKPHRPGVTVGLGQLGSMQPVLSGQFVHSTPATRETMKSQLLKAAYSIMNEWGTLKWRPSNSKTWREVQVQLLERPDIQGDLFKTFQLMLVAEEPFIYGETMHEQPSAYYAVGGGGGLTFPFTLPITFTPSPYSGAGTFVNAGENDSYPVINLEGPITSPTIRNATTGKALRLSGITLATGEYAVIDMQNETVYKNGDFGQPLMQYLDVAVSDYFPLVPGENQLQLVGSGPNQNFTRLTVYWKDSYL